MGVLSGRGGERGGSLQRLQSVNLKWERGTERKRANT